MFGKYVKLGVRFLVGVGVGTIVENVVKSTAPFNVSTFTKITTKMGELALSGVIGNVVDKYVVEVIDGFEAAFKGIKIEAKP